MHAQPLETYFDYAAAAPPFAEALDAQARAADRWFGNPSAAHGPGRAARAELERLRRQFSGRCGFAGGRLVLTSGATEANNWAIHGTLASRPNGRIVLTPDVHASVWNACQRYAGRVDVLPLDGHGRVRARDVAAAIATETALVCCPHVASETGVIQDVATVAALCERRDVACLVDGTQAVGRIPVDLSAIAADFYAFSAHKFGGPRGCGGVFLHAATLPPLMDGGAQEGGLRPGTENLAALAGAAVALERSLSSMASESDRLRGLTRVVLGALERSAVPFLVNGDPATGAPGFLSLSFAGLDGHALVTDLSVQGFAVSSGSACTAHRPEPSRAILALGRSPGEALGTLRISFGRSNSMEAVTRFARGLADAVRRQQEH